MKINKFLVRLKTYAMKLKGGYQLPTFLFNKILVLGVDSDIEYVNLLMELTDKYMRVKGFYSHYKYQEDIDNEEIKKILKERGYN